MSNSKKINIIDEVSSIGKDAQALVEELQPRAQQGKDLTKAERKKIERLIQQSESAMSTAERRAKEARKQQIAELEKLVNSIDLSLGTPGLSLSAIEDLKKLKRNKLTQLTRLRTRIALDFAGILSSDEITEIASVLKHAREAIRKKKKAAAFLDSILKIANLSISIVAKAGKLA